MTKTGGGRQRQTHRKQAQPPTLSFSILRLLCLLGASSSWTWSIVTLALPHHHSHSPPSQAAKASSGTIVDATKVTNVPFNHTTTHVQTNNTRTTSISCAIRDKVDDDTIPPRQKKQQRLSTARNDHDKIVGRNNKMARNKQTVALSSSSTGGGVVGSAAAAMGKEQTACLRRLKREWRDAVKLGIAYDWTKMTTLGNHTGTTSSSLDNDQSVIHRYSYVRIGPLGKNLLRWHFSVMGPANSDFEGGIYHGRVLLPKEYPAKPPRIQVLTPSGRFVTGQDICLSASSFHPESWTPKWTVLSLVDALRMHMLTTAQEIGGKDDSPQQRRHYARASRTWKLGRTMIDHGQMVRDGIFPWQHQDENGATDDNDSESVHVESTSSVTEQSLQMMREDPNYHGGNGDAGRIVQVVTKVKRSSTRRRFEVPARKNMVQQKSTLPTILLRAVIEVLTSPVRLAAILFLTVFAILNRH